jgi:hypothetical protein
MKIKIFGLAFIFVFTASLQAADIDADARKLFFTDFYEVNVGNASLQAVPNRRVQIVVAGDLNPATVRAVHSSYDSSNCKWWLREEQVGFNREAAGQCGLARTGDIQSAHQLILDAAILARLGAVTTALPSVVLRSVTLTDATGQDIQTWAEVHSRGFLGNDDDKEFMICILKDLKLHQMPVILYMALLNGAAVSSGWSVVYPDGTVVLSCFSTIKKYRKKGLCRGLGARALLEAAGSGCQRVILTSQEPQLDPFYSTLGFEKYETFYAYSAPDDCCGCLLL